MADGAPPAPSAAAASTYLGVGLEEMAGCPPIAQGRLVAARAAASAAPSTGDGADDVENADGEQAPTSWSRSGSASSNRSATSVSAHEHLGGVGLFLLGGLSIAAAVSWTMGVDFNKMRSYQAFVEFPFACGIQVGTRVRVRGQGW